MNPAWRRRWCRRSGRCAEATPAGATPLTPEELLARRRAPAEQPQQAKLRATMSAHTPKKLPIAAVLLRGIVRDAPPGDAAREGHAGGSRRESGGNHARSGRIQRGVPVRPAAPQPGSETRLYPGTGTFVNTAPMKTPAPPGPAGGEPQFREPRHARGREGDPRRLPARVVHGASRGHGHGDVPHRAARSPIDGPAARRSRCCCARTTRRS